MDFLKKCCCQSQEPFKVTLTFYCCMSNSSIHTDQIDNSAFGEEQQAETESSCCCNLCMKINIRRNEENE